MAGRSRTAGRPDGGTHRHIRRPGGGAESVDAAGSVRPEASDDDARPEARLQSTAGPRPSQGSYRSTRSAGGGPEAGASPVTTAASSLPSGSVRSAGSMADAPRRSTLGAASDEDLAIAWGRVVLYLIKGGQGSWNFIERGRRGWSKGVKGKLATCGALCSSSPGPQWVTSRPLVNVFARPAEWARVSESPPSPRFTDSRSSACCSKTHSEFPGRVAEQGAALCQVASGSASLTARCASLAACVDETSLNCDCLASVLRPPTLVPKTCRLPSPHPAHTKKQGLTPRSCRRCPRS